jgi:hypothetical protein
MFRLVRATLTSSLNILILYLVIAKVTFYQMTFIKNFKYNKLITM